MNIHLSKYIEALPQLNPYRRIGRVVEVIGLTVVAMGLEANIGELCQIFPRPQGEPVLAEVVGFREGRLLLMPLGEISSVGPGSRVVSTHSPFAIQVGEELLGRVLNGLGQPLDGRPLPAMTPFSTARQVENPLRRQPIRQPLGTGIRAIDCLLTVGRGQRMGIFAGSGVGKSTLLGMIARNTNADVNVIALIGERGREVRDFLDKNLGPEGLARSVVVVATSDQPALVRMKGAVVATAIAEFFREQGRDVLLMMDSVTRFAMAAREVGLASGEPPATRGYPPSVFAHLPKLLERTGTGTKGSITAFYTVLVDGDDMNEPVSDAVRGILDGHIVLERKLAQQGHFPAIDVLQSVSRVMDEVIPETQRQAANRVKELLSIYRQHEDLITIGAYQAGHQPKVDQAVRAFPMIQAFLKQDVDEASSFEANMQALFDLYEQLEGTRSGQSTPPHGED
jgi:flagellum-specific ATP synthase